MKPKNTLYHEIKKSSVPMNLLFSSLDDILTIEQKDQLLKKLHGEPLNYEKISEDFVFGLLNTIDITCVTNEFNFNYLFVKNLKIKDFDREKLFLSIQKYIKENNPSLLDWEILIYYRKDLVISIVSPNLHRVAPDHINGIYVSLSGDYEGTKRKPKKVSDEEESESEEDYEEEESEEDPSETK